MLYKKVIKVSIVCGVLIIAGFLIIKSITISKKKKQLENSLAFFQPFTAYQNDKPILITRNMFIQKYLMIAYISTDCDHCDYMAQQLTNNINKFSNYSVVLVVQGEKTALQQFINKFNLGSYNGIKVLHDKNYTVKKQYNISTVPVFFMYNEKGKRILDIKGETKIENLLKVIQ